MESDGLLDELTKVHALVLRDMDSDRVVSCTDAAPGYTSIADGLRLLSETERAYGHNAVAFDQPAIKKMFALDVKPQTRDTYLIAAMRWAHIKERDFALFRKGQLPAHLIGKQTLEAWGYRLGIKKAGTDIEDWSVWTKDMQDRCESDTAITKALVQRIRAAKVSPEAVETEHELAYFLRQQERNGWPFDIEAAQKLQAKLAAKREAVADELRGMFKPWKKSLGMFTPKANNKSRGYVKGVPVERFKTIEFNPGSRDHIANRLKTLYGWTPSAFTDGGKPQVDEKTLKGLDYPPVPKLREYLLLTKRLSQIAEGSKQKGEAWLKHATQDGPEGGQITGLFHIHGSIAQNKAVTHRAAHFKPNTGQVPKVGNPFGAECRALWMVPPDLGEADPWVQIGADASGLELRCLAHYMAKWDDGAYGKILLEGDVHSVTQQALAEWVDAGKKGRDTAKTWMYAFLYGAGDEKLGRILIMGATEEVLKRIRKYAKDSDTLKLLGGKSRAKFLTTLPALKYLVAALEAAAKKTGYILGIDGRRCYVRHMHAVLNTLLQSCGAIICKRWIVEYNRRLCAEFKTPPGGGWRHPWAAMGWIHDETQTAARKSISQIAANHITDSIRDMTAHFNFRCPLDGEAKFGRNWAETH